MESADLFIPQHGSSPEEKMVYHVMRASHSRSNAMWCIVCGSWFKKKNTKDAELRALSGHCAKTHFVEDGLIKSRKPKRGCPVPVLQNTTATATATPANATARNVAALSPAQTSPVKLAPPVTQRTQPAPPSHISSSLMKPSAAPAPALARAAPVKPPAPLPPVGMAGVTPAPAPVGSRVQLAADAAPPPLPASKSATTQPSTGTAGAAAAAAMDLNNTVPGALVTEAQATQVQKPGVVGAMDVDSKAVTTPTQVPMDIEPSSAPNTAQGASGSGAQVETHNGVELHKMDPIVIPPTPPGYEASFKAKNKQKEVRKRGHLLLPVRGLARKIAGEAQQMLFDETGLLFHNAVFIHPPDKESALKLLYGAVPDSFNSKNKADIYGKVWGHQQFLRADMARIGYKFFTCKVRKPAKGSSMPPVEDWLEIRKIVSVKKKRAPDAAGAQNNTNTATANETSTQANPNANTAAAAEGPQKDSPKVATKNAPKIPPAATPPKQPAAASTPGPTPAPAMPALNRTAPVALPPRMPTGNAAGVRERTPAPTPPMPQRHTTSTTSSSVRNNSPATARKTAVATGSTESAPSAPAPPTARKTPNKRRRSLRSEQQPAGSKKPKKDGVPEVIDLT